MLSVLENGDGGGQIVSHRVIHLLLLEPARLHYSESAKGCDWSRRETIA